MDNKFDNPVYENEDGEEPPYEEPIKDPESAQTTTTGPTLHKYSVDYHGSDANKPIKFKRHRTKFCRYLLVLAIVVVIGVIAAICFTFLISGDERAPPSTSIGDTSPVESGVTNITIFSLEFTIEYMYGADAIFIPEYSDHFSTQRSDFVKKLEQELNSAFVGTSLSAHYLTSEVIDIRNGSIVVNCKLYFRQSDRLTETAIAGAIFDRISSLRTNQQIDQVLYGVALDSLVVQQQENDGDAIVSITPTVNLTTMTTPTEAPSSSSAPMTSQPKSTPSGMQAPSTTTVNYDDSRTTLARIRTNPTSPARPREKTTPVPAATTTQTTTTTTTTTKPTTTRKPPTTTTASTTAFSYQGCGYRPAIDSVPSGRIVGGVQVEEATWPWSITIRNSNIRGPFCGGTIVNKRWIMTAAHCFEGERASDLTVAAGALDSFPTTLDPYRVDIGVDAFYLHPLYDDSEHDYDIGLIKLSTDLQFNDYIFPACLPPRDHGGVEPGTMCRIAGWGAVREDGPYAPILREAQVPIVSHEDCLHYYDNPRYSDPITERMLCAGYESGGIDACEGDSGGPMICQIYDDDDRWYLMGIVSWGYGCAAPLLPGIYTKVDEFHDFFEPYLEL